MNSIAPNIIIVQENSQLIYSFIGEYQKINDFINNIVKTNIIDDKIVKNIEINKIIYGKDINYDVEATRINREISKNDSKLNQSLIVNVHIKYNLIVINNIKTSIIQNYQSNIR